MKLLNPTTGALRPLSWTAYHDAPLTRPRKRGGYLRRVATVIALQISGAVIALGAVAWWMH
jgi:hypothetical protein